MRITKKTPDQIAVMHQAGVLVAQALRTASLLVQPGVTTQELDQAAEQFIRQAGALPAFKGYHGFPATLCLSVNEEIVHGIPGPRVLREADVVSLDAGAIVDGWFADAAVSVGVGTPTEDHQRMIADCEYALAAGVEQARPGNTVADISAAVAQAIHERDSNYGIVQDYTGHGIGTHLHEAPDVPNHLPTGPRGRWARKRSPRLEVGMVLAIEPMITLRTPRSDGLADGVEQDDGWTVVSSDGSWGAHFEHTVAITAEGPQILTTLP